MDKTGLNIGDPCPSCSLPLQIHYGLWCPTCEKPEPKPAYTINLIKSLAWLERHGFEGLKEECWNDLCEYHNLSNDSYVSVTVFTPEELEKEKEWDITGYEGANKFLEALMTMYEPGSYLMEVSW